MNLRSTARGLPQRAQRVFFRTENFGSRFAFVTSDFFAIYCPSLLLLMVAVAPVSGQLWPARANGRPNASSSARACASLVTVVTRVMSMPRTASMSS